jgi:acetyl-CoA synthetase
METEAVQIDWTPGAEVIANSNITWLMQRAQVNSYPALHHWSTCHFEDYWTAVVERLEIRFKQSPSRGVDLSGGPENPRWLPGAEMNIVDSCFSAPPDSPAVITQREGGALETARVSTLKDLSGRVAAGLVQRGFRPGDALALFMPMTVECVAIYLGILQAGYVADSLADSFRPKEIRTRLKLANAVGIFTQDVSHRGSRTHPLYAQVLEAEGPPAIVIRQGGNVELREGDCHWDDFLADEAMRDSVPRLPADPLNILFSSGTTGEPKAIPWNQTTPIKCAADGHFHQDIHPGDVVVWPTNIGWMMGPWLIFAALLNRAAIGLFDGVPTGPEFCRFVQDAGATQLGLVPSLVKAWRNSQATSGLDWTRLRVFSSTGECSNAEDMRWLMAQADGRPVIEYCGGTEIGGGYITGAIVQPASAGTFNTPALGLDFVILNEQNEVDDMGEVFLYTPSMGLSTRLLNKDHHESYFAGTPPGPEGRQLRRHGDQLQALPGGFWRALGRADDTMNLGGIKVSSAEIERVIQTVPGVKENAAVAVSPQGGPGRLIIYAVWEDGNSGEGADMTAAMRQAVKTQLNPLFKIHEVLRVERLPRTASNKVMHRVLRDQYREKL